MYILSPLSNYRVDGHPRQRSRFFMNSQGGTDAAQKGPGVNGMMINTGHEMTPSSSNHFGGPPAEFMQYD